ncbi:MAG: GYF domain-containing protein [Negativicutes bacterium]|nr:GYF domain-containing protein [Negativicutes bacterium]
MVFNNKILSPNLDDSDQPPASLLEENPDIAAVLAMPVELNLPSGGLFDEYADQLEMPVEEYVENKAAAEAEYGRIFSDRDEDELSSEELNSQISSMQDTEETSVSLLDEGITQEAWDETESSLSGLGALAGGAAILAGAGVAMAKMAPKEKEQQIEQTEHQDLKGWYYHVNGQTIGPVDEAMLKQLLLHGELDPNIYVWKQGMAAWATAVEANLLPQQPAPQISFCGKCGNQLKPGAKFCGKCGHKI